MKKFLGIMMAALLMLGGTPSIGGSGYRLYRFRASRTGCTDTSHSRSWLYLDTSQLYTDENLCYLSDKL